jgi:hypothetical protein
LAAEVDGDSVCVPLAGNLLECAERCELVLQSYFASAEVGPDTEFRRAMIFAVAAMRAAAEARVLDGETREAALLLVVKSAGRACDLLRNQGFDRELMLCADDCDRAAKLCADALASTKANG